MNARCEIPRCRAHAALDYLGRGICETHWNRFTADGVSPEQLRMVLGIAVDAPSALEETMAKKKTQDETQAPVAAAEATVEATPAVPAKRRRRKAAADQEAAPVDAPDAEVAPTPAPRKRGKKAAETQPVAAAPTKEDLVVFAFRLTQAERDAIHRTAGPRNATQFIRRVAVAFAHEDESWFRDVLKEAREARS